LNKGGFRDLGLRSPQKQTHKKECQPLFKTAGNFFKAAGSWQQKALLKTDA
jgi:hypothetical protein